MGIRLGWVLTTAAAYGVVGGELLYAHLWDAGFGPGWTDTARIRLAWATSVFLISTWLLVRRNPYAPARWLAFHSAAAFVIGAAVAWSMVEYRMTGSQHPWDTVVPPPSECLDCARRAPIILQTVIVTLVGSITAAGLTPLMARSASPRGRRPA